MPIPQVSVVIPAWNVCQWIEETLTSVIFQTIPVEQLEILLIDDGSTDNTSTVASNILSQSKISHVIIRHERTLGPSAARNTGWRRSQGSWIQFLDADDLLEPDKIESQLAVAQKLDDGTAAVFSPWGRLVLEESGWSKRPEPTSFDLLNDPLLQLLKTRNAFHQTGCQIFKRSWLEAVDGYDEDIRLLEDVDLIMRILIAGGKLGCAQRTTPGFWYRKRRGSLSHGNHRVFVDACLRNYTLAEKHWRDTETLTPQRLTGLTDSYFSVARFMAEYDSAFFEPTVAHLLKLEPSFVPPSPVALRQLTKLIGYRRAERFSVHYRKAKRFFKAVGQ